MWKKLGIGCAVVGGVIVMLIVVLVIIGIAVDDDVAEQQTSEAPARVSGPEGISSDQSSSVSGSSVADQERIPTPIVVSARQLYADYERNEVAADKKYVGNYVEVTGVIASVSEAFGKYDVKLETDDFISVTHIVCKVDKDEEAAILALEAGQTIAVLGKMRGLSVFDINLDDCRLVSSGR